jgi:ATP-dependent protease ClpP protease subunit
MRDPKQKLYRFWGRTPPPQDRDVAVIRSDATTTTEGKATLYLYGPIDSWGGYWGVSAAEVAEALAALPNDVTSLDLRINSPGGEVFEAVAIMNLLRDHQARITARVDGVAASAASFLAASADELIMGGNTELMIHDAWGLAIGNAAEMRAYADLLDRVSNDSASVYAAKAGGTSDDWRQYMLAETWFSAEEAVTVGLADSVNTGSDDAGSDSETAERFDTAALFQYAGRTEAPTPAPVPKATGADGRAVPIPAVAAATQTAGVDISLRHRHNSRRITR